VIISLTNPKREIIKYLLGAAIVLLVANITIDFLKKPKKAVNIHELSVVQIENVFFKVLDEYGIESNWIAKKKHKSAEDDSIKTQYEVKIPADMPVPLIIKDINKIIEKDITGFVSEEKKIFGTTEIRIYTNEVLKLKATLIPDKQIIRHRNDLSFIITDAFDLNTARFNNFLSEYFPIACVVVPGKDLIAKADSIKNYTKDFVILLNNDITDSNMKLKSEYSKGLLRGSINNIVSSFRDAKAFIVDERSTLFNSPIYNFVRDDFKHYGINLFPQSEFIDLSAEEDSELVSKFKFYCNDTTGVHQKIFMSSFENYEKIQNELVRFKKKGNKIIPITKTYIALKPKSKI